MQQHVVIHHQGVLVGHEVLEGIDPAFIHQRSHVLMDLVIPMSDRHVE